MSLKLYGDVKFSKFRIGADEARAPMATCGYFNRNQAANTAESKILYTLLIIIQ